MNKKFREEKITKVKDSIWGSKNNWNNKIESEHYYKEDNKGHQAWGIFNGFKTIERQEPKSTKLKAMVKDIEDKLQKIDELGKIEYWITKLDGDEPIFYIIHTVLAIPGAINYVEDFIVSHENDILEITAEIRPELEHKLSTIIRKCKQSQQRRVEKSI